MHCESMAKKTFACKDIGMQCGFKTEAASEAELMPKIAKHAKEVHGMDKIDDTTMKKIKAAIKSA